jgi:hypothetical protein
VLGPGRARGREQAWHQHGGSRQGPAAMGRAAARSEQGHEEADEWGPW